ncbi:unnamed protein product, partial [Heterotrigona itama]
MKLASSVRYDIYLPALGKIIFAMLNATTVHDTDIGSTVNG